MSKGGKTSLKKMAEKPEVLDAVLKETVDLVRLCKNGFFVLFLFLDSFFMVGCGYFCRRIYRLRRFLRI